MEKVPSVISSKDLDYLSDMFNFNYGAYKCMKNAYNNIQDIEIKNIINKASNLFYNNMNKILNILERGNINE